MGGDIWSAEDEQRIKEYFAELAAFEASFPNAYFVTFDQWVKSLVRDEQGDAVPAEQHYAAPSLPASQEPRDS